MQAVAARELELVCGGGKSKGGTSVKVDIITVQTADVKAEQANVNLFGQKNDQDNTAFIGQKIGGPSRC